MHMLGASALVSSMQSVKCWHAKQQVRPLGQNKEHSGEVAVTERVGSQQPMLATQLLTSPVGSLSTWIVFPQEAGGMLERVESKRQEAICTEQG